MTIYPVNGLVVRRIEPISPLQNNTQNKGSNPNLKENLSNNDGKKEKSFAKILSDEMNRQKN